MPLVFQQAKVIQDETDLKVGTYVGDMGVDFWDQAEWQKEFKKNHVLVMTAQIFLDILHHGFLGLSKANLLVFDECHHAKKEHPFKRIMTFFDVCPKENYPRVLGLTASVVNGKVSPWKIESEIKQLEATLRASCQTASDAEEIVKYGAKPFEDIVTYSKNSAILEEDDELLSETLKSSLTQALEFLNDCRIPDVRLKNAHQSVKSAVRECLDTLKDIGPWSAYQVAGYLVRDLGLLVSRNSFYRALFVSFMEEMNVNAALNLTLSAICFLSQGFCCKHRLMVYLSPVTSQYRVDFSY